MLQLLAMPCETLLVEVDDELWTSDARQLRWNQHRFGAVLPLNEKGEFTFDVGRTDNLLRLESILERILLVLRLIDRRVFVLALAFCWLFGLFLLFLLLFYLLCR